ncbi:unnamed protein product [Candidula unifasciata]|uniref:PKD domain-containing protein n=1 Tax=Candidula unifasciata TaxID=100452 RepID=A0A8S3ZHQ4_9EUPU|nr:unnamed protein product [Candidula unifasciata]
MYIYATIYLPRIPHRSTIMPQQYICQGSPTDPQLCHYTIFAMDPPQMYIYATLYLPWIPHRSLGTPSTINFTLSQGSDYTCTWNFGDNTPLEVTDETSTPKTGASKLHTYKTTGDFILTVNCSNKVSTVVEKVTIKVLEAITNLRMVSLGAQKGQDYALEWTTDSGEEITFVVIYDGVSLSSYSSVSKYRWKTSLQPGRAASSIPLSIKASNPVSQANISATFQILSVIVNPTLTTVKVNLSSHELVNFTVNMDSGSDVTVVIDYGDGESSKYDQPLGVEWVKPVVFQHTYVNGGRFTVTATISNAAGTYKKSVQVLVLVSVLAIECQMVDHSLYHPPAYVNLTFNSSVMPTEPTLTLNWGEPQSQDLNPTLQINVPYTHTFGDTGVFTVTANLSNLLGHKTCQKSITIVEKLSGPSFHNKFTAAAKGLPFSVTFCLYRGPSLDLCNLTFNFGDGGGDQIFPRQGNQPISSCCLIDNTNIARSGKDGCDTKNVTYTDTTTKLITVTATSYLETVTDSVSVPVIIGLRASDIEVTSSGNQFGGFGFCDNLFLFYLSLKVVSSPTSQIFPPFYFLLPCVLSKKKNGHL